MSKTVTTATRKAGLCWAVFMIHPSLESYNSFSRATDNPISNSIDVRPSKINSGRRQEPSTKFFKSAHVAGEAAACAVKLYWKQKQYKTITFRQVQVNLHYYFGVDEEISDLPPNAFLVIEAGRIYPLVKPVINIGRGLENHVVIDDLRASRSHAQLRASKGHFVLFDLNSTGGTFVNGQRITETILYPGDTISVGGVILMFKQEDPPPRPDLIDTVR